MSSELNIVTGAFGYTGKYITRELISRGKKVLTLTGHPDRPNPFGNKVAVAPFNFNKPDDLMGRMQGATTLYNTYWVRFAYGQITYHKAITNTILLINAAKKAGIGKIVHVSITNASESSSLPYFKGKGVLERAIIESGLSYAIIRPTVIFGQEDILINNIAWLLRRCPMFVVPGSGDYKLQPIFVEDIAKLAVEAANYKENAIIDAVGPEIYSFNELVQLVKQSIKSKARIVHLKPNLAYNLSKLIGYLVHDVVLTQEEVEGLMANLLLSRQIPTGETSFKYWLEQNSNSLGVKYASEIRRHYRWGQA